MKREEKRETERCVKAHEGKKKQGLFSFFSNKKN